MYHIDPIWSRSGCKRRPPVVECESRSDPWGSVYVSAAHAFGDEALMVRRGSKGDSCMPVSRSLAILLSVLLPGLGHIYLGRRARGAAIILLWLLGWILILITIGYAVVGLLWLLSIIDVIRISSRL